MTHDDRSVSRTACPDSSCLDPHSSLNVVRCPLEVDGLRFDGRGGRGLAERGIVAVSRRRRPRGSRYQPGSYHRSTKISVPQFAHSPHKSGSLSKQRSRRPLKVEIIVDPNRVPPQPLTSRLGAAPAAPPKARAASSTVAAASGASGAARQQTRATGGRGRGRGGRSGERRAKPTVESLDAEMSDYLAQASNVAAPAA
ncbi:BZ3500_MvSof-1268-A1-R1_Chr3-1g05775 [Microbotryum saponariae]|uniref:BZ3500_MvSof-1268-A1-R1_Chr3-1g05775 protein n=1 Tax=Microbotryum saponariae TaxID=289078 RepID=A0A2X0L3N8_9BASI|nr:BZ3500_MvSof-1268-A1-R1_Chr3-1g05775 [Microbotryum saponariae]SDA04965.1 BZ3501_MvSof-1269-A2-R1_Chr3-1g05445 [Microbotryum saponariae]